MPPETDTPPPKQGKGRQRHSKKVRDLQPGPVGHEHYPQVPDQSQGHYYQPYSDGHGYLSPQHHPPEGPPKTTPRKRQGKNERQSAARNGYHSDTGTTHFATGTRPHSTSQSVDISGGHGHMTGANVGGGSLAFTSPTPTKQQVYAGPAFFASPAASSLPIPKAFAKTMPPSSIQEMPSPGQDRASAQAKHAHRSPATTGPPLQTRGGSPLDMLFNADRAERSRKASETGSPLAQMQSASRNGSRATPQGRRSGTPAGASNREVLLAELDGSSDQSEPEDAVRSVPFKERMQAIAEAGHENSHPPQSQQNDDDLQRQAKTHALKQLLMAPEQAPQQPRHGTMPMSAPPHGSFPPHREAPTYGGFSHSGPYHGQTQNVRPSAASPSPQDLRAMEDNLRRVLKMGPSS